MIAACRCTIGGAGGKLPLQRRNESQGMPNPPKTKNVIASVIQKKNDGWNARTAAVSLWCLAVAFVETPRMRFLQAMRSRVQPLRDVWRANR